MAIESLPLGQYKRGFVLGANGHLPSAGAVMGMKIPQLHALLKVLTDADWTWNDDIKTELIELASSVANDIHEAHEQYLQERIAHVPKFATENGGIKNGR